MRLESGDLIESAIQGQFDVVVHGCNCFNTMGAGLAKNIQQYFPEAYSADCRTKKGDRGKLGTYTQATVNINNQVITIVNAYTQYYYGRGKDLFEYEAFQEILEQLCVEFHGKRFGFPLIGCGLAGGDRDRILTMIKGVMAEESVVILEKIAPVSKVRPF